MRAMRALGAVVLAAVPALAAAQDFPALEGAHPVLITVDDLPIAAGRLHPDGAGRERLTRDLLAVLRKHDIKAVGFVTWRNVKDAAGEGLLDLWLKDGHELGNHSYTHPDYPRTDTEAYVADMEKARATLAAFLEARGRRLRFFRFPFLREGDTTAKLARMREWLQATGQRSVPVTIDTQDWSFEEPWVAAERKPDPCASRAARRGLPACAAAAVPRLHRRRRRAVRASHAADPPPPRQRRGRRAMGRALHLDEGARVPVRHRGRGARG